MDNMQSLIDRITKDVVSSLQNGGAIQQSSPAAAPKACSCSCSCGASEDKTLIIAEGTVSDPLQLSAMGSGCDLLNLTDKNISFPNRVYFSPDDVKISDYTNVVYAVSKYYQLTNISLLRDNYKGVEVFFNIFAKKGKGSILNMLSSGGIDVSKVLGDIKAMGIGICNEGGAAAPRSQYARCEGLRGECTGCGRCHNLAPNGVKSVIAAGASRVSATLGSFDQALASQIDHTLLKPDATKEQIIKLCQEAKQYNFASVCVNPGNVKTAYEILRNTPVKVCTVIGFPLGATTSVTKAIETRDAVANGAREIDMVINVGALKAGNYDLVEDDIRSVVDAASGNIVKVIIETALLTDEEKVKACQLSKKAGADFVKTSTGFGPGGATAKDVALMRETVGEYMGVKASGGIRDLKTAQEMIKAGASRIGASASVAIVKASK